MLSRVTPVFIFLCLPRIISTGAPATSINVSQSPKQVAILRGTNITFYCIIPLSHDNIGVEVRWWKQGENKYLANGVDGRKRFERKSKGGGLFELRNATPQDSGIYHCGVIRDGKYSGNGTGSSLTVWAAPTPLKILLKPLASKPSTSLTLVCQTAAFYPGDLTLIWYKDGTNITAEMNPIKQRNAEGLYEVSSSLEETQLVRDEAVYICLVTHISLRIPAIAIHTVTNSCPEADGKYHYIWISGCAVGGLAFLILIIIIGTRFCLKNKGKQDSTTIVKPHDELAQRADDTLVTYAAVDLKTSSKTPRFKCEEEVTAYAQLSNVNASGGATTSEPEISDLSPTAGFEGHNVTKQNDHEHENPAYGKHENHACGKRQKRESLFGTQNRMVVAAQQRPHVKALQTQVPAPPCTPYQVSSWF